MEYSQFSKQLSGSEGDIFFSSLLINEIENENIDKVKWLLLHKNADPNLVLPNEGVSPMHVLAGLENECFSVEVLEIALVERGGDPNIRSTDGLTPVHLAALWGRCTALEFLLKFGGDPFLLDFKCSLNAEDLALREHQWQTHAILATFSVFHDKNEKLDDYLHISSPLFKSPIENCEWPNSLSEMTYENEVGAYNKEYPPDCGDSISKNLKSQDSLVVTEADFERKCQNQTPVLSKSNSFYEASPNLYSIKPIDEENTKEQDKMRRKKLSDQFAKSFTKFKNFFGRASLPKLSLDKSPTVYSKIKGSKTSI